MNISSSCRESYKAKTPKRFCPNPAPLARHLLPYPLVMIMKMTVMTFCHLSKGIKDSPKLSVEDDKNTFGADSSLQKGGPHHYKRCLPLPKGIFHLESTHTKGQTTFRCKGKPLQDVSSI
jgi:hypothetical protein